MPWNPDLYNKFKDLRYRPFFDLADLIQHDPEMKAVDLGCGTGEQTALLSAKFPDARFLGIDSSQEMLAKSKTLENEQLRFEKATTEEFITRDETWDLLFSNAALQWSDHHQELFLNLLSRLKPGGQVAIQMPCQPQNILNQLLAELAEEVPFHTYLKGWNRPSSVLTLDEYARVFFENGIGNLDLSLRVYPIIAETPETFFEFISGSALIPYLEKLDSEQQQQFVMKFKERIAAAFPKFPALYAFKRLLLYGRKQGGSSTTPIPQH